MGRNIEPHQIGGSGEHTGSCTQVENITQNLEGRNKGSLNIRKHSVQFLYTFP